MSPDLSQVGLEAWHSLGWHIPTVEGSPEMLLHAVFNVSSLRAGTVSYLG